MPRKQAQWLGQARPAIRLARAHRAGDLARREHLRAGSITNIGLLYLLPVMVAATRYGVRTGVVTGLASSLAYNFFFIPPTRTFTIQDPQNIMTVLVLMGVAVVSSQLAARVRDQAMLAQRSAAQNSSLAGFARLLTGVSKRERTRAGAVRRSRPAARRRTPCCCSRSRASSC
jgi:K+-sensing histidine kinase KdpD